MLFVSASACSWPKVSAQNSDAGTNTQLKIKVANVCACVRADASEADAAGEEDAASDAGEGAFVADANVACEAGCAGADVRWLPLRCRREAGFFMTSFPL